MARTVALASSQYLRAGSAPFTGEPFSIAAWCKRASSMQGIAVSVGNLSAGNYHGLICYADNTWGSWSYDGDSAYSWTSSTTNADTWYHFVAVFSATNSRTIFMNGSQGNTNSTDQAVGTLGAVAVGASADSTPANYFDGTIAEAALYNVALGSAEAQLLALGISPLLVKPNNLAAYYPLLRDTDQDLVGGHHLTPYNTPTVSTHPPIVRYPRFLAPVPVSGTGAGGFTERGIARGILRGIARGV